MKNSRLRTHRTVVVDFGRGEIRVALAETAGEAVRFHGITVLALDGVDFESCDESGERLIGDCLRLEVARRGWDGLRAACLLSGAATSTQSFVVPSMSPGDLRRAIRLKLGETLHFEVDEAYFDFRLLSEPSEEDEGSSLTLVAAARIDAVRRGLSTLRYAGLKPVAVGAAAESLANLSLFTSPWSHEQASVHVDVGVRSSILNLFEGNRLRFSREIDTGAESFLEALARPILTPEGAVQLSREQAEHVLEVAGCPAESSDEPLPYDIRTSQIQPLMEPVLQRLSGEVERSADYLRSLLGRSAVDKVVLSGTGGRLRALDRALAENLGTPVVHSDPVERALFHWRLAVLGEAPDDLAGFAAILGYSLGNRNPINLLPREEVVEQSEERVTRVRRTAVWPIAAAAASIAVAGIPLLDVYDESESSLAATRGLLESRVQRDRARAEGLAREGEAMAVLREARGLAPDWIGLLKELSVIVPDPVRIESLELEWDDDEPLLHLVATLHEDPAIQQAASTELTYALTSSPFFLDLDRVETTSSGPASPARYEATLAILAGFDEDEEVPE